MISLFKMIVLFAVVIILLAAILSAVFWVFNKLGIDTRIFAIKSTPPTLEIRFQILERLKTVSQLHTAIALVQTIVTDSQGKRLLGMEIGSTKILYVAVGQVRAGVDLSKLSQDSVTVDGKSITVSLPPAEILDSKLDVENSYVYDVRRSAICSPDAFELQSEAQKKALEEIVTAAKRCGVLDMAAKQAQMVMMSLLRMAGFEGVEVRVGEAGS